MLGPTQLSAPLMRCCAVFIEDGIETGNIIRNNLIMLTRASDSLLNTDTNAVRAAPLGAV